MKASYGGEDCCVNALGRTTLLTAALAVALAGAPPAAGDTLVHGDPSAENVTAHGGVLMWSRRDAGGRHHLVQRAGAVVSDAPVASSDAPLRS